MDLQSLANLGEAVSAVAVVVSLVYLAIQVRQNTESQRTDNYLGALDRIAGIQSRLSQDGAYSRLFARGVTDTSLLTNRERIQFTWALYENFGSFEFLYHAAQTRSIPEEVWERWSAVVAWFLSFPGVVQWWQARPAPFTSSFTAFVEALIRDNPTDTEALDRWSRFIAGDDGDTDLAGPASQT